LRLYADPELSLTCRSRWRRKVSLPPCRLVWVGDVVGPPAASHGRCVVALVTPFSTSSSPPALCVVPLSISTLGVLTAGRVLKGEPADEQPVPHEEPASEQRFPGSEWSIELWFGSSETSSIASLDALELTARYSTSPLCVSADPAPADWCSYRAGRFSGSITRRHPLRRAWSSISPCGRTRR
jgi:hypothetical protein